MVNLARRYLRKQEAGFTLVEVLVSAMMMFGVLFALYAIFDVSVRAFGYGGDRLEAVGNARLALGRMEREIRAAYPYDLTSNPKEIPVSGPHGSHKAGCTYDNPHRVRQRDRGRPQYRRLRSHRLLPQRTRSETFQGQQCPDAHKFGSRGRTAVYSVQEC
ncbi:MAG TPA: type II secretion system protein [Rubrobacter sp.]|nr:type II secretion system protein [Rubrobacter sp.]